MKRQGLICLCIIGMTILTMGCSKETEEYLNGIKEINAGNYYAAIDEFTVVTGNEEASDKEKTDALLYMAEANLMLEQEEDAITIYKTALEYDPKNTKLLMTIGNILQGQGKVEEAIEYFELAVSYGDKEVLPAVGAAYMSLDCYDEAKNVLLRYYEENPTDAKTNYYLSKCCYELGDNTAALVYAENALYSSNEDYNELLLYHAAVLYEDAGQWDKALQYMEEYISLCPEDEKAMREYTFITTRVNNQEQVSE